MININMNSLLKSGISRYALVIGVAKRASEITTEENENRKKNVKTDSDKKDFGTEKSVTLAVNEYLDGKYDIVYSSKKDAAAAEASEEPVFTGEESI
ncbi:MAG: DNA-directed RNA polymerase subunit omega [Clostridia bacterium]|nr:hypothetical protein [Oscillospiraceae bacterium]MBR2410660.1 DNA-directed RNA polymerase subunit omega [Clostridia bacterium]